jgi:hypothetical protein
MSDMFGTLWIEGNELRGNNLAGRGFYMNDLFVNEAYFVNNFIHIGDSASTSTSYGLYLNDVDEILVANNSFFIESQGSSSRGIYDGFSSQNMRILNNNVYNNGPGYGVYYQGGVVESDYNNLYVPNGYVGYSGGAYTTLSNWQSGTSFGDSSVSVTPGYFSKDDLHTCQDSLDGAGLSLDSVWADIDREPRDTPNPDIGADEFFTPSSFNLGADREKCPAESVTIGKPFASGSFAWSTGDTTPQITVTSPGMYTLTATSNCGTAQDSIEVTDLPAPQAGFKQDKSNYTVYLENQSTYADSFYWDFGDGYTSDKEDPFLHIYDTAGT